MSIVGVITRYILVASEVEDHHIVELLSQLEDSTEDVHFLAPDNGCVAAASNGSEPSVSRGNLRPRVGLQVEGPQVAQLVVVIVLTAKDVELVAVKSR